MTALALALLTYCIDHPGRCVTLDGAVYVCGVVAVVREVPVVRIEMGEHVIYLQATCGEA